MKITLTNRSGRCLVFVLPHASYCAKAARCACRREPGREPRRIAGSLTIAANMTSPPLDRAVLLLPEVARARDRGALEVMALPSPSTAAREPASAADSPRTPKKRGS